MVGMKAKGLREVCERRGSDVRGQPVGVPNRQYGDVGPVADTPR